MAKNNTEAFIKDDPVQFPHRYSDIRDIEIVSFLVATIAWGNRKMILNNANKKTGSTWYEKMMNLTDNNYGHYSTYKNNNFDTDVQANKNELIYCLFTQNRKQIKINSTISK